MSIWFKSYDTLTDKEKIKVLKTLLGMTACNVVVWIGAAALLIKENTDLAAFINGVLEQLRESGEWNASYQRWLAPYLGDGTGQPAPVYGRS